MCRSVNNTSIIDRLKYHDIDPKWSYLGKYYEGMGLGNASQYKGTAKQNTAMIKWMRKNGYSTGGTIGKLINGSGEDGFVLAKEGEHILNTEQLAIASAMVDKLLNLAKLPNTSAINGVNYTDNSEKNITMNFNLPNVSNGQDFVDFLKTKKAQNIIQSYTIDEALGKNSLNKFKHK